MSISRYYYIRSTSYLLSVESSAGASVRRLKTGLDECLTKENNSSCGVDVDRTDSSFALAVAVNSVARGGNGERDWESAEAKEILSWQLAEDTTARALGYKGVSDDLRKYST